MQWNSKQKKFELGKTFNLHPNSTDAQDVCFLNQLCTQLFKREYVFKKTVLFLLLLYVRFLNC